MSSLLKQGALTASLLGAAMMFAGPAQALKCTTNGGIGCESDDGQFATEFGGRIMVDLNVFDDDSGNGVTGDHDDGLEIRRLRFFNKFTLYGKYFGKIQVTFLDNEASVEDAYIGVDLGEAANLVGDLIIGQEKIPFGLEELTSSKYITFIERSLTTDYITGRTLGAGHHIEEKNWTLFTRVYSPNDTANGSKLDGGADAGAADGIGFGARGTFAPINTDTTVLHLGAAAIFENNLDPKASQRRARVRPEAHLAGRLNLIEGTPSANFEQSRYGIEAAFVTGPFSVQGEFDINNIDDSAGVDEDITSGYVFASFFVTPGDSRTYKDGSFGRIKPKSENGALELALRYSYAKNDDAPTANREAKAFTVGANYYLNKHVRVMLNYVKPDFSVGGADYDENIFLARIQADYGD